jgi:aminoglycoside phosphotransferase (APT) family kinase protein
MGTSEEEIEQRLADRLTDVLGQPVRIEELRRLTAGANSETWSFQAHSGEQGRRLVLRRQPGGGHGPLGMTREAEAIAAAAAAGVAVPPVVDFASNDAALGAPYLIAGHIDGETIPRKILRDERYAGARAGLAAELGRTLARIHSIPLDSVPALRSAPPGDLEHLRTLYLELDTPSAVTEIALSWLADHQPEPVAETVVHGDFRNGNLIISESGLAAVLDWELTHIGDPREDLGWLVVKCWRFGTEPEVGGFGSLDELLDGYEEIAGHRPDAQAVRWWQIYRTVWWSIGCAQMAQRHLSGEVRSVELAAIGRRVCEQEHDALLALGYPAEPVPTELTQLTAPTEQPGLPWTDLHGRPTTPELITAVTEFLRNSMMGSSDPAIGFHARVAANVLDIVGREMSYGRVQQERQRQRLAELGVLSESELALAIRGGTIAADDPAVLGAVRAAVTDRLLVANPRYLTQ